MKSQLMIYAGNLRTANPALIAVCSSIVMMAVIVSIVCTVIIVSVGCVVKPGPRQVECVDDGNGSVSCKYIVLTYAYTALWILPVF
jgi:hypothetical protein